MRVATLMLGTPNSGVLGFPKSMDFSETVLLGAIAGLHCATLELVRDQPGPMLG